MPIALALPFAEAAGIAVAGLSAAAIADKVNEYIKLNPEDSMMILKMINPASAGEGLSTLFKKKAKTEKEKEPSIEDLEEIGEDLSQADKAKVMKAYGKSKGAGKRQRMIDIAKKLGLAGEGKERQKTFDEVEGRYEDSDFEEERTKPKFDYTKFFKANGGRINYEEGGIINSLQNIIGQGLEYGSDAGRFILGAASGIPGIGLGITALQNLSNKTFSNLPIGDQLFITEQMGTTDDNKDAYGYNIRSMFGNYGDLVTKRAQMAAERQRKGLEQRAIDEYYTRLEIERQAAEDEARRRAITTANQNIDYGGFVSGGGTHSSDSSFTGHSSATGGGMDQSGWGGPRAKGGFIGKYAQGGRVNYQAGGVATPEQYAKALQQVGAGSALDKLRSTGDYIKNYVSNVGESVLNKNPAIRGIASFYGVGKPISSFSDFSSGSQQAIKDAIMRTVQNPTFNQYSKTNIPMSSYTNYFSDRGEANTRGIYDTGYISRSDQFKDMISALGGNEDAIARMTLGRFNVDIDPTSGVGYLRDKYDFSKQMPGGKAYDINMQLPQDFVQQILNNPTYQKTTGYTPPTTQTTSSIPQFYQNNPGSYDFDKFKEAYAFATGQQNLVSRTSDGQIVTNFGNWDPSRTYQAYMSNTGTSSSRPFFEQFAEGNPFQKNLLVSMYGAPGAGKSYYADGGLATMFVKKR